ncbi:MAG: hypothetical protein H7Z74_13075 [Anaerolineae bacterium]|nr:hypothetical protein [Gemmatimonadaceae bacterium]
MEGDEREVLRRALLQDHQQAELVKLQGELQESRKHNEELRKRVTRTRNTMKVELESQGRMIKYLLVLVLIGLFGTTKPGQDLALLVIQGLAKGFGK